MPHLTAFFSLLKLFLRGNFTWPDYGLWIATVSVLRESSGLLSSLQPLKASLESNRPNNGVSWPAAVGHMSTTKKGMCVSELQICKWHFHCPPLSYDLSNGNRGLKGITQRSRTQCAITKTWHVLPNIMNLAANSNL